MAGHIFRKMKSTTSHLILAAIVSACFSPAVRAAQTAGGHAAAAQPLDALTAYFVFHKLTGQEPNFDQLASQTNKVRGAAVFNTARIQAQVAAALRARYEAADPAATYTIGVQTKLNYQLDQQRFEAEAFQEGSVLPLQPFRDEPIMPMEAYRHHGVRLAFANADAARFVPLAAERARVIDSVARHGVTGAAAEVTFRFIDAENNLPRTVRAEIASVRYGYDRRIVGYIPMSNPALWPLKDPIAVAAVDREELASAPKPLNSLTALFLYHKLADEPLDFDAIARQTHTVYRAPAFEKDKAAADMAATLREKFDAADPAATYTITLRAQMRYDMNQERYEVDTFGPDRYLPMVPFRPQGGVAEPHRFANVQLADQYNRRLMFLNAGAARYLPLAAAKARAVSPAGGATVVAEVRFAFVDTQDIVMDAEKTLRAQITSVQYAPGIGRVTAAWPLQEPIAIAAAEIPAAGETTNKIDDLTVFNLYHKLAGEPIDFEGIAGMLQNVARAGQFEKANVQAAEVAKMKARYEATDPEATYSVRVRSNLKYELEQERFEIELFEPGRHLLYRPLDTLGVDSRHATQAQLYHRKLVFANGASARYIPLPKAEAAKIGNVAQYGSTGAAAELEFRVVGAGDPTGAVDSGGVLRAEILALRFDGLDLPVTVTPYDPKALREKPVSGFDIVGLKTGVPLTTLQRAIEKEFGPIGAIRPGNNEDPRLVSGIGHNPDGCFTFGNRVAAVGNVCIRAFADDRGTVRKIIVEQILEGADWEPIREALLQKYGAMSESVSKSNNRYYAWGPEVARSVTMDEQLAPQRALAASVSTIQSAMDRMAASTRVSTNLRIRLVDPDWAGAPAPEAVTPAETPRPSGPRL